MHLEVKFKLSTEDGEIHFSVCRSLFGLYVVMNRNSVNWINRTGSISRATPWVSNNRLLRPYLPAIRQRFYDVIGNFKWNLPKRMRNVVASAKIDLTEGKITLKLDRWIDPFAFDNLLRIHCWNHRIKPLMPVYIHDSCEHRRLLFDLRLNSKQQFPSRAPITDSDMDRLGPKL